MFLAREVHGLSTEEIAARHGVTPNHLWVLLHRCRQALRHCLELNWFAKDPPPP
jgi:RNA polymerase sigma-70 factor (ECF subfamily)